MEETEKELQKILTKPDKKKLIKMQEKIETQRIVVQKELLQELKEQLNKINKN